MTSIDFHFNTPDRLHYACRLTRKIVQSGQANAATPLAVYCRDSNRLARFDELLWSFSPTDFLPHGMDHDAHAEHAPIRLTSGDIKLPSHHLLLNLDDEPPSFFSRFVRLLEVVSLDETDREQARLRYAFYRDRGYALTRYDLAKAAP